MKQTVYLTLEEAAKKYKTSTYTLRRRIKEGKLKASKPFGVLLISESDLENWIKKHPVQAS